MFNVIFEIGFMILILFFKSNINSRVPIIKNIIIDFRVRFNIVFKWLRIFFLTRENNLTIQDLKEFGNSRILST
jgi:hypothetical protein